MIVPAKQTITEVKNIDVEINEKDVLRRICWKLLTNKPKKAEYIEDGYWYVFEYEDYHKGTAEYEKDRAATAEEIKIYEAYNTLIGKL